jgi:hypothetical protein
MEYQDYLEIPSNRASALKEDNWRAHREIENEPLSNQDKPYQESSRANDKVGAVRLFALRLLRLRRARPVSTSVVFTCAIRLLRALECHREEASGKSDVAGPSYRLRPIGTAGFRPGHVVAFCPTVG